MFLTCWNKLRAAHEKREAFGAAGVGQRAFAHNQWALLNSTERSSAAAGIDWYTKKAEENGYQLKKAAYYFQDRAWSPAGAKKGSATPARSPAPPSAPLDPATAWKNGVALWAHTGNAAFLPGNWNPDQLASWPAETAALFRAAVDSLSPGKRYAAVDRLPELRQQAPQAPQDRPAQVVQGLVQSTVASFVRSGRYASMAPKKAKMSQDDILAYQISVGDLPPMANRGKRYYHNK